MNGIPPLAQQALERAKRGDLAGAVDVGRKAVAAHPDDYGLRLFMGMLHSRRMELVEALTHVQKAASLAPSDPIPRAELVRLLIGVGKLDDAERELGQGTVQGLELLRLQAMIYGRRDQPERAVEIFRQIVAKDPRDHESWGNLGSCMLAQGLPHLAVEPFTRALQLRPELSRFQEKLLQAQTEAGSGEQALAAAHELAAANPTSIRAHMTVARLQVLLGQPAEAIRTLQQALTQHPHNSPALVALAHLLERANRIDEFTNAVRQIEALNPHGEDLPLLRARVALRSGELDRALELAKAAPETVDRGSRAQLIGTIEDRLGNSTAAFRAFEEMNSVSELSADVIAKRSQALRDLIDERTAVTTTEWVDSWSVAESPQNEPEPAFLIGFPRSGTTLLDTFLMGHPELAIAEEKPMLQAVSRKLGDYERLAKLDAPAILALREEYFRTASLHVPELSDRLLVDKFPLGAIELGIFHRLFPTGKIIFLKRHPCDVILSCFFTQFHPTPMLISFQTLEDAAKLYDKVMSFWQQFRTVRSLNIHEIAYEDLVTDPASQLRRLFSFLDIEWDDRVTDHQTAAAERKFIASASYAQVIEPLHDRSVGRWKRYRTQLAPVLPTLLPWAKQLGYEL